MFQGQKILVVGLGRSGIAAAHALVKRGAEVTIYDGKDEDQLQKEMARVPPGVRVKAGALPGSQQHFDMMVISPGIPLDAPDIKELCGRGMPVIGELELAYRLKPPGLKLAAVTGTNGKTTTTALIAHILCEAGIPTAAAGNIGLPLSAVIDVLPHGIAAVEVSSFQLETTDRFHPVVSGILNITPDHLDRHCNMESYAALKAKIFANQEPEEYAVLNADDPRIAGMTPPCRVCSFSARFPLEAGVWVEEGKIMVRLAGETVEICPVDGIRLRGKHNLENALCAAGMTGALGIPAGIIGSALTTFTGVRHRLEEVAVISGVTYINDSKGTNPESTMKALESFSEPVILLAGGRSKGTDFSELALLIKQKVKALVVMGEASGMIAEAVVKTGFDRIYEARDFEQAVYQARDLAAPGDIVLLSPACASWDMFNNFEERGDLFCSIVRSWKEDEE